MRKFLFVRFMFAALLSLVCLGMGAKAFSAEKPATNNKAMVATPQQKEMIEQIIHDYLIKNPEVLLEASRALQEKQRSEMMEKAKAAISKNSTALFNDHSPIVGNAKGTVNIVEFFDYQCIHCRNMTKVIGQLIKDNKDLRVVYKEFPIFGENSEFAAKAALASQKQGKYAPFHEKLMAAKSKLNRKIVLEIAKSVGIDTKQLERDIKDPKIEKALEANRKLAIALGVRGTPAFVIAAHPYKNELKAFFIPGAASTNQLQSFISQVKEKPKT